MTFFSSDSSDVGRTKLSAMDTDAGDSNFITQKPYTLPLKYVTWVKQELKIPERAGDMNK